MTRKGAHIIFWVIAGMEILGHFFKLPIVDFTKPLLMPALLLYFKQSVDEDWDPAYFWVVAALLLSWAGDVSLMYNEFSWSFILGLSCFLLAHISYVISFVKFSTGASVSMPRWVYLPLFGYLAFFIWLLVPVSGTMTIPVIAYAVVIITMLLFAVRRNQRTSRNSFLFTLAGALLFVLSDSLIGINKFYKPIPWNRVLIMSTYIVGQFAIIQGLIIHQQSFQKSDN